MDCRNVYKIRLGLESMKKKVVKKKQAGMGKRGQEQVVGEPEKSSFIVKLVGFVLVVVSLSALIGFFTTNIWTKSIIAIVGVLVGYFSWKSKSRLGEIISLLILGIAFLLFFFEDFLIPVTEFLGILKGDSIYPFLLLVCAILLFLFGKFLYKILGFILFAISLIFISEFLMDISSIFNFLSFLSQYGELKNSLILNIIVIVIGFICLMGGTRSLGFAKKGFGAANKYGKGYVQKGKMAKAHGEAIREDIQEEKVRKRKEIERKDKLRAHTQAIEEDKKIAFKKANENAKKELDHLKKLMTKRTPNSGEYIRLKGEFNNKLLAYQRQGLLMRVRPI